VGVVKFRVGWGGRRGLVGGGGGDWGQGMMLSDVFF
jgi:hypothetical protein